jgi:hypothetical protein
MGRYSFLWSCKSALTYEAVSVPMDLERTFGNKEPVLFIYEVIDYFKKVKT